MRKHWEWAAAVLAACALVSSRAGAQDAGCTQVVTRENVAVCARARSFLVRLAREDVRAAEGRRASAAPLLPSNPVLAGNAAHREGGEDGPAVINWQASIAQEIEIAGQRGARLQSADEAVTSERERSRAAERDAVATAWGAYFDAIAASEQDALARGLAETGKAFVTAATARAEKGLASPLDADLARAAAIRFEQTRIETTRAALASRAELAIALGLAPDAPLQIRGSLEPLPTPLEDRSTTPPELRAAEAEAQSEGARADSLRRERVPNPTVSVFGGREEYNRTYYGVGLTLPLPLPEPVGRTHAGAIAEAEALSARARIEAERIHRDAQRDTFTARATFAARREAAALFRAEDVERARISLVAISDEVSAGRLPIRDALVAEQSLLEMLRGAVDARRDLCRASVELARLNGALMEGGSR